MTAWTAIVIPVFIAAKCALDFIGLEYSPKHQCMTDQQFTIFLMVMIFFSASIDIKNFFKSRS